MNPREMIKGIFFNVPKNYAKTSHSRRFDEVFYHHRVLHWLLNIPAVSVDIDYKYIIVIDFQN